MAPGLSRWRDGRGPDSRKGTDEPRRSRCLPAAEATGPPRRLVLRRASDLQGFRAGLTAAGAIMARAARLSGGLPAHVLAALAGYSSRGHPDRQHPLLLRPLEVSPLSSADPAVPAGRESPRGRRVRHRRRRYDRVPGAVESRDRPCGLLLQRLPTAGAAPGVPAARQKLGGPEWARHRFRCEDSRRKPEASVHRVRRPSARAQGAGRAVASVQGAG